MSIQVSNLKMINKGALVASFNLELPKLGMTIRNCSFFSTSTKRWISMPGKSYEKNGEKKFFSFVYIEKEKMESLTRQVLPLVEHEIKAENFRDDLIDEAIPF